MEIQICVSQNELLNLENLTEMIISELTTCPYANLAALLGVFSSRELRKRKYEQRREVEKRQEREGDCGSLAPITARPTHALLEESVHL